MFRSKKSLSKHVEQAASQINPPQPVSNSNHPQANVSQFSFRSQSILPSNIQPIFSPTPPPTLTSNHPKSLTQLDSLSNESQLQSFTALLQPSLSLQPLSENASRPPTNQNQVVLSTQPSSLGGNSHHSASLGGNSRQIASDSQAEASDEEFNEHERRLLDEVEIVDELGNLLRMQRMSVKDVYMLEDGEKILVHVDEFSQPIKAAGGLYTRFMTLLVKQPNLCPLDITTFPEMKKYCGAKLVEEIQEKFSLPLTSEMDKVIFDKLGSKFRSVKYRFKEKLLKTASVELKNYREKKGLYVKDEEKCYTEEQLHYALDLVPCPSGYADHQWEKIKSNIRSDEAKEMSMKGKEARNTQIHTRTIGSISYARREDMFVLEKKRKPTEVEFFELAHKNKDGQHIQKESQNLMDTAKELVAKKVNNINASGSLDSATECDIQKAVWKELMEGEGYQRPILYGIGVNKSQVSKLSDDLRQIRSDKPNINELSAYRARVTIQDQRIDRLEDIVKDLISQVQTLQVANGMSGGLLTSPIMNVSSLGGLYLPQAQGQVPEGGAANVDETTIPSAYIPSP